MVSAQQTRHPRDGGPEDEALAVMKALAKPAFTALLGRPRAVLRSPRGVILRAMELEVG
jgi:hypothetical protein